MQIIEISTTNVFKMDSANCQTIKTEKSEIQLTKYEINEKGELIKLNII